jgi:hypothetical protein
MKAIVATREKSGEKATDKADARDGELMMPHVYLCLDDNCECQFAFVSLESGLQCSTFKVVELPDMTEELLFQKVMEYLNKVARLAKQSNMSPMEVTKVALDKVKDVMEMTSKFPEDAILEVDHQTVRVRGAVSGVMADGEKKGRGRPVGSKNKPKEAVDVAKVS